MEAVSVRGKIALRLQGTAGGLAHFHRGENVPIGDMRAAGA